MWASGQGQGEIVSLLIARGADPSLRDDRGLDAASIAREAGHSELVSLLAR
jgi:ankyrin repeat protein